MAEKRQRGEGKSAQLSIGALSAATGINIETIRSWERRYGFPRAQRKPSGHRVYPVSTVARLRRVSQAIARGHRTSDVIASTEVELDLLLATLPVVGDPLSITEPTNADLARKTDPADDRLIMKAIRAFDAAEVKRILQMEWARLGPLDFLERRLAPLLTEIGKAWASGVLEVRHEHFASAIIGDFLRMVRTPFEERSVGPVVLLATPSGELHGIGLQMAAVVFAISGWSVVLIGVDTPAKQIAALSREASIVAIGLSVVGMQGSATQNRNVGAIRKTVGANVPILVGGAGALRLRAHRGVLVLRDLYELHNWISRKSWHFSASMLSGPGPAAAT